MAPEWAQVEFSVAVTLSGVACGQLAWRGCVWCGFARFGAKMAAAAQLQNDAGGGAAESKRNRVVLVAFRPKRYNTMDYMGCGEMLRSCGKFLGGGQSQKH